MFRKLFFSTLLIVVSSSLVFAQAPAPAPSVDKLREHVTYLASEKLEGRRTGTTGASEAARYLADEFKRLGLQQIPREVSLSRQRGAVGFYNSYLQPFPYVSGIELGKTNQLMFRIVANPLSKAIPLKKDSIGALVLGQDWIPLGISTSGKLNNLPGVWVGYGITAAELNHDDYAVKQVAGKVAIALAGTPDDNNPHGQFARYEGVRWKAIAARNAGAKALILVTDADLNNSQRLRYDNTSGDAGLPIVLVSRAAAAKLLSTTVDALAAAEERLLTKQPQASIEQIPALPMHQVLLTVSTDLVKREGFAANVVGILQGSDPVLKNEAIVIGAHYDHLGRGGEGSLAPKEGEVHHGADDNASGTAGLLELARIFSAQKPRRTIVFTAFSGEEEGLLGSNYYVNHPPVPLANTIAMINMDMIGRMKDKKLVIGGVGTAPEWRPLIETANLLQGVTVSATGTPASTRNYPLVVGSNGGAIVTSDSSKQFVITMNEDGFGPSDHSSFYAKQIPVLFFWTGTHEDYHKPSDTADKINYTDQSRILAVVARIVRELDSAEKRPTYAVAKSPAAGRSTGFRVYLGTIPNYSDSNEGLLLDGVREDSPAAKAGLKAGDRIVKLAGRDVRNVYDYTHALSEMKADNEYEVEVLRGTTRLTLKLTPAARK